MKGTRAIAKPQRKSLRQLQELLDAGQYPKAERNASELAERHPGALELIAFLGDAQAAQKKYAEAAASYARAIEIDAGCARAHTGLGSVLMRMGMPGDAASSYLRALDHSPEPDAVLRSFATALADLRHMELSGPLAGIIARCVASPTFEDARVTRVARSLISVFLGQFFQSGAPPSRPVSQLDEQAAILLTAYLECEISTDPDLELMLARLRAALLDDHGQGRPAEPGTAASRLLEAIARQCFLNEYIWHAGDREQAAAARVKATVTRAIGAGNDPDSHALFVLAAYYPLHRIDAVRQWALTSSPRGDERLAVLLATMVLEPERERELAESLEQLTAIDQPVSRAVREQYEQNPYPRWKSAPVSSPVTYTEHIQVGIAPHRPALEPATGAPDVLIAGCGTGKHPVGVAGRYANSSVLAIDLSTASLAYASRKAEQLGVTNIRFAQADILNLGQLEQRFDVIECSGVLHHMERPEQGLKVLVSLLNPGGFMKLALYSELARASIVEARSLIADRPVDPTAQGIRAFRNELASTSPDLYRKLATLTSFYNISGVRDLLLHVQEHRYRVPELEKLISGEDLEFLGFVFRSPKVKELYLAAFPDDPDCTSLANWDAFERDHPVIFTDMYQFWCRKRV